jgi:hypothetical protein
MDRVVSSKIKLPWQRPGVETTESVGESKTDSETTVPSKPNSSAKKKKNKGFLLQTFAYDESKGYIYCAESPNLVFGVESTEGKVNPIVLQARNENNIFQKWYFDKHNRIVLKTRPHLVLTIQLPPAEWVTRNSIADLQSDKEECIYLRNILSGAQITLQPCVATDTGGSFQKWSLDKDFGFIYGFQANDNDISTLSVP